MTVGLLFTHIKYLAENSTKQIHMLGRSAKVQWGLGNKALKTIYEGAMIPLLTEPQFGKRLQLNKTSAYCRGFRD